MVDKHESTVDYGYLEQLKAKAQSGQYGPLMFGAAG